jgi:hypothetical protein
MLNTVPYEIKNICSSLKKFIIWGKREKVCVYDRGRERSSTGTNNLG